MLKIIAICTYLDQLDEYLRPPLEGEDEGKLLQHNGLHSLRPCEAAVVAARHCNMNNVYLTQIHNHIAFNKCIIKKT